MLVKMKKKAVKKGIEGMRYKPLEFQIKHLPNKKWLYNEFITKNRTLLDIAEELQISFSRLDGIFKYYKLTNIKKIEEWKPIKSKKWLFEQVKKRRTLSSISQELNIDPYQVKKHLEYYDITKGEEYSPQRILMKEKNKGLIPIYYNDPIIFRNQRKKKYLEWLEKERKQDEKEFNDKINKIKKIKQELRSK